MRKKRKQSVSSMLAPKKSNSRQRKKRSANAKRRNASKLQLKKRKLKLKRKSEKRRKLKDWLRLKPRMMQPSKRMHRKPLKTFKRHLQEPRPVPRSSKLAQ